MARPFIIPAGGRLVCLGDSITEAKDGYVSIVDALVQARYPERAITIVNAGIGGHRAPDMLERIERDVIAHRPSHVTISVGINDVWHGFHDFERNKPLPDGSGPRGVGVAQYTECLNKMIWVIRESTDAAIILLPPTVIGEDIDNPANLAHGRLQDYVKAMHGVGTAQNVQVADTHETFVSAIRAGVAARTDYKLTTDGVHLNAVGNALLALSVLRSLGFEP